MRVLELASEPMARSVDDTNLVQSTIGAEIRRRAELQPDHPALVASGFAPLSYRDLQRLVDEVRVALRQAGFGRGARIAISVRNGPQAALAIVAIACSAVSIPLNPRQTLAEIETSLAALQPDAVLVTKGADSAARRVAEREGITIIEATQTKDNDVVLGISASATSVAEPRDEFSDPQPSEPAFILQTSGTSSEPKLIPTSHCNMIAAAARVQAWFDLTPEDRCLCVSPVFYAHGLHVTVFAALLSGGTIAFPKDAAKFDYSEWFEALRPTWYSAGPTLHRLVLDHIKSRADAKIHHSLRFVLSGGAPLPRVVLEGLEQTLGVPVVEHYGSSEGMQICSNLLPPRPSKRGTVGVPWPDTIRIVGDDGRQLPAGEWGEILVGGPTVVSRYLDAPELSRISFVDGWFKTGDIGSIDEDGFLALHGRKDDMINRGGEKISPVEIDNALMRHAAVAEAASFPVPHPRLGEDLAAAVVLRPGISATPVELRSYLQGQLAPFKIPRRIVIYDQLPKGQTGKVLRRRLAESVKEIAAVETPIAALRSGEDAPADRKPASWLIEIWERLLKTAPVSADDDFFESGGDSLIAMEMLAELERFTGRTISNSILLEAPTICQLAQRLSEPDHQRPTSLALLNSGGREPPLFYFHSDFNGYGYSAIQLARLLGPDQPVWVVHPHGIGNDTIPSTIEAMAADRLPLILRAEAEGPFRLCGGCVAGIVAFEVARLLVAAGKKVELVVMLDPPTINARRPVQLLFSTMRRARPLFGPVVDLAMTWTWFRCMELQKFCNVSWARRWSAMVKRVPNLVRSGTGQEDTSGVDWPSGYAVALSNYSPTHLAVRVIFFSIDYGGGAWRRICSGLEEINSGGNHFHPDFANVAKRLTAFLQSSAPAEMPAAALRSVKVAPVDSNLISQLTKIWERLLNTTPLSPDDDFFENGGDSLLATELLAELERLTGKTISSSILIDAPTIHQLAKKLSEPDHSTSTSLTHLNSSGSLPPLFYFDGDFNGNGYSAIQLARLLGPDQPVWIVPPHGTGNDPIPSSIEAMAVSRIPLILEAQPEGPFQLCGGCVAGIVAFEVARILIAAGKRVEVVVMLDPPTINARWSIQLLFSIMSRARPLFGPATELAMARIWFGFAQFQKFCNISRRRRWTAILKRVRNLTVSGTDQEDPESSIAAACDIPSVEGSFLDHRNDDKFTRITAALSNYSPRPLAVRVAYIKVDYGAGVWRRLSPDLEIIKSPGDHYHPDFADVAKHLKVILPARK